MRTKFPKSGKRRRKRHLLFLGWGKESGSVEASEMLWGSINKSCVYKHPYAIAHAETLFFSCVVHVEEGTKERGESDRDERGVEGGTLTPLIQKRWGLGISCSVAGELSINRYYKSSTICTLRKSRVLKKGGQKQQSAPCILTGRIITKSKKRSLGTVPSSLEEISQLRDLNSIKLGSKVVFLERKEAGSSESL